MKIRQWHIGALVLAGAAAGALAACNDQVPILATPETRGVTLDAGPAAADPQLARQLSELKQSTAKYHDLDVAMEDYPGLVIIEGLTSPDGCVSDAAAGGMGYHYAGAVALDDEVDFRTPELLVYAPVEGGPRTDPQGNPRARLAAFDYFIPYSDTWPDGGTAPTSEDMGLAIDPPIDFAPSRFGGWMFHIWLWEHNPDGMFSNWNSAIPLCEDSPY